MSGVAICAGFQVAFALATILVTRYAVMIDGWYGVACWWALPNGAEMCVPCIAVGITSVVISLIVLALQCTTRSHDSRQWELVLQVTAALVWLGFSIAASVAAAQPYSESESRIAVALCWFTLAFFGWGIRQSAVAVEA